MARTRNPKNVHPEMRHTFMSDKDIDKLVEEKIEAKIEERDANMMNEIPQQIDEALIEDEQTRINDGFDVFVDAANELVAQGDIPYFEIKKDNQYFTTVNHPFSWDRLQKEYKGGHYRVICKRRSTNKYYKSETRFVSNPPILDSTIDEEFEERPTTPTPPMTAFSPDVMLTFIKAQADAKERDAEMRVREARQMAKEQYAMQSTLMQTVSENQRNNQELFYRMNENTLKMMKEMQESTTRQLAANREETMRLIEKLSDNLKQNNHKPELSLMDVLKMQADAREEGERRIETMLKLAEAKGEEKLEMWREMEAEKGSSGDDSLVKTAIKAMLPLVAQAGQQMAQVPQQKPVVQPQRRVLPQTIPRPTPPRSAGTRINQVAAQHTAPQKAAQDVRVNKPASSIVESLGLPSIKRPEVVPPVSSEPVKPIDQLFNEASQIQRDLSSIAVPKLAECLAANFNPQATANEMMSALKVSGFAPDIVLANFTFDFVWQVARSFGIEANKKLWFEEFYAHFQASARNDVGTNQGVATPG